MTHATDQARSTRSDARAFADAFAEADDAFTFGPDRGESRELSLEELGDVIALRPADLPERAAAPEPVSDGREVPPPAADDDRLLTLDELSEALLRPAASPDVLDFDFGTSARERARRRTAARLDASTGSRRRASGPGGTATRPRAADVRLTEVPPTVGPRFASRPASGAEGRAAMADAAASAAERLAGSAGTQRFAADRTNAARLGADGRIPGAFRPSDASPADPDGRRTDEITGRPGWATAPRLREVERRAARPRGGAVERLGANPDRIAMWAVLLGILLVLIAFTTGSAGAVALPLLSAL